MCSTEQNSLYLKMHEHKYSFQDGTVGGSNRSRIKDLLQGKSPNTNGLTQMGSHASITKLEKLTSKLILFNVYSYFSKCMNISYT